jgi:putative MFS transporter
MSSIAQTPAAAGTMRAAGGGQSRQANNYFDGLPVAGPHKRNFFIIMMAYFFEQMDNWNFSFIAPAIFSSWGLSPAESNTSMARILFWYFIGMTAGGFLGGVISDVIGRRRTFLLAIPLLSLCSLVNGLPALSLPLFILARSLTGFWIFCLMVCSQAYIAEMAPAESRGKWQGVAAAVGFCAVPAVAFLCRLIVPLSPEAWRWIFYCGGVSLIGFFIALKYLAESPRWLVSQGRVAEAEDIVRALSGRNIDLREAAKTTPPPSNVSGALCGMFTGKYIGRTLLLLLIFAAVAPAGFTCTAWTGKLLAGIPAIDAATGRAVLDAAGKEVMLHDQAAMLTVMAVISCGAPAGCCLASLVSDAGGRKIPLAAMYLLASGASLLFAFSTANVFHAALCGFLLSAFNMAGGFILFSYTAESYPTRMRGTAAGAHNGIARLSVSAFQCAIPVLLARFGGTAGLVNKDVAAVFTAAAVLFLLPVPFVLLFGRRTGGTSLEDIS